MVAGVTLLVSGAAIAATMLVGFRLEGALYPPTAVIISRCRPVQLPAEPSEWTASTRS